MGDERLSSAISFRIRADQSSTLTPSIPQHPSPTPTMFASYQTTLPGVRQELRRRIPRTVPLPPLPPSPMANVPRFPRVVSPRVHGRPTIISAPNANLPPMSFGGHATRILPFAREI